MILSEIQLFYVLVGQALTLCGFALLISQVGRN